MGRIAVCCSLFIFLCPSSLFAHGTKYEILGEGVIGVKAMFDTGDPMAESKAIIFAPGSSEPYLETVTDKNGILCFKPDKPGTWIIQVREISGHGMRINLPVNKSLVVSDATKNPASGTTCIQKVIMALCVLAGFAGTALYFKRVRQADAHI